MEITRLPSDDPVTLYLRELSTIPPLPKDEETELWQRAKSHDEVQAELAKRRLIESRLSLVVSIAGRYSSTGISMLDLIQEGNRGLMVALNTFAESEAADFSIHAAACIEKAISEAIAESHHRPGA